MNINEMIIRDINLSFNIEKFLTKFVNMLIMYHDFLRKIQSY